MTYNLIAFAKRSFYRILLTYGDNGEIILRGKGSGGLTEMKKKLNDNHIYVGVVRIRAVDDFGSHRAKFVYINYVGANVVRIFLFSITNTIFKFSFISRHYVLPVLQHINLILNDFLMVIIFRYMLILKKNCPKKILWHYYKHVLVHINHKLTNSDSYSFSFSLILISLLDDYILYKITDQLTNLITGCY
jgi:hypothetical protein